MVGVDLTTIIRVCYMNRDMAEITKTDNSLVSFATLNFFLGAQTEQSSKAFVAEAPMAYNLSKLRCQTMSKLYSTLHKHISDSISQLLGACLAT